MSGGTNTTNYNLYKPTEAEDVDITQINSNMDIVDTTLYNQSQAILENTSDIQALQDSLDSAFITREITSTSHTINANSSGSVDISIPTIAGYTPVGVVGFQNNKGTVVMITACKLQHGSIFMFQVNTSSSAQTVFEVVNVLFVRSEFVD